MNTFFDRYADVILHSALKIRKDDVLSINTEEENLEFARLLARKAKEITDNGSYLMILENGKEGDMTEIFSDYKLEREPTLFLHLLRYDEMPSSPLEKDTLSARDVQLFRHLASPLLLPKPSIPFVTVPLPSYTWGAVLSPEEGSERLVSVMISDLLGLDEDEFLSYNDDLNDTIRYDEGNLNRKNARSVRLYDDDGMDDITFSFLPSSRFTSDLMESRDGRLFLPSLLSTSFFRAVDKRSANGYVTSSLPFMVLGHTINNISITFENGRVSSFETDEESARYFKKFLSLDEDNLHLAELVIAEDKNRASEIPFFAYPEWDRMRASGITLGSPRGESLLYESEDDAMKDGAACSLECLFIPIGTSGMSIETEEGDYLMEDGVIDSN